MPAKPSRKRAAANEYDDGDDFVAREGSEGRTQGRSGKKAKTGGQSTSAGPDSKHGETEQYWELSGKRRVSIEKYGGKTLISIREFYEKDGDMLPGKKGISLTMSQYAALLQYLPALESALSTRGETVVRPMYSTEDDGKEKNTGMGGAQDEAEDERQKDSDVKETGEGREKGENKKNYEATSESEG